MKFWLIKSEPSVYSIDDLSKDKVTSWGGVRNYQARNFMMNDMKIGDPVLFYHSSCEIPGIYGLANIYSESEPDTTALDKKSEYFDPKATKEKPIWYCVKLKFKEKFYRPVTLKELREQKALSKMELLKKGSRLSIQPVTEAEHLLITNMFKSIP